jgi:uncharacterized Fe-S cluster protein YjdI
MNQKFINLKFEIALSQKTFKYTNGEVTVLWKPDVCTHSAVCIKGLPGVFDVKRKPWIDMSQSDTNGITEQVRKCPSGALSYVMNERAMTIGYRQQQKR